jgi:N-acetylglutamate synthase-like GNAT family acetyltransferase
MRVRRANLNDVTRIREIVSLAYAKWIPAIGRKPLPMAADYDYAVAHHLIDLCELDGSVIALVEMIPKPDHLLIENIAVDPAFQGKGIGVNLMRHAEQIAAKLNLPEVQLYTNSMFTENLHFYARRGYEEFKRGSVVPGSTTVYFRKISEEGINTTRHSGQGP